MTGNLTDILRAVPTEVLWKEIIEFNEFDLRMDAVGVLFSNTIGVCDQYMEFCPDNTPPHKEETLSWIWVCRPDLYQEILEMELSESLQILIESYRDKEMDRFWKHTS